MKIRKEEWVYITPDKDQTLHDVATEIANSEEVKGKKMFFNLPDGNTIAITGKTVDQVLASIATQWSGSPIF